MCTNDSNAKITNAPCLMKKGVGLYGLISKVGVDPNASLETQEFPEGINFHLGEKITDYKLYDIAKNGRAREAGGIVYKYADNPSLKSDYNNGELFFKILDNYYDDNSGQYRVSIKSGLVQMSNDPVAYVTKLVKEFLFGASGDNYGLIRNIFLSIVKNPGYQFAVSALLTLYVMFSALQYLSGNLKLSNAELIIRVCKIAIISVLLGSEKSWTFFNDYLFAYFIGGVEQILSILTEAGSTGTGSPSILGLMMAQQTLAKLISILFVDPLGWLYIILFLFALYFIILIFFKAAVIYLSALMSIGLIIIMGPIFLCFMLFEVTRSLFDNWLKQLISYAVQPIILFTGMIFISILIRDEIYGSLGFRVCKYSFPVLGDVNQIWTSGAQSNPGSTIRGKSIFYWWFPVPMKGEEFSKTTVSIPIPLDHKDSNGEFCEAYGCVGERYIDLPYLDPAKDQNRLQQFWNGKFVQLDGLMMILIAVYLLHKFNSITLSIAKFIGNTSNNKMDVGGVYSEKYGQDEYGQAKFRGIGAQIQKAMGLDASSMKQKRRAVYRDLKTGVKRAPTAVWKKLQPAVKAGATFIGEKFPRNKLDDKMLLVQPKGSKIHIDENIHNATLEQLQKRGITREGLDVDVPLIYKYSLTNTLIEQSEGRLDRVQAEAVAESIVMDDSKTIKHLDYALAAAKYGKSYEELDGVQKLKISDIGTGIDSATGEPSLADLAKSNWELQQFEKEYQETYKKIYAKENKNPFKKNDAENVSYIAILKGDTNIPAKKAMIKLEQLTPERRKELEKVQTNAKKRSLTVEEAQKEAEERLDMQKRKEALVLLESERNQSSFSVDEKEFKELSDAVKRDEVREMLISGQSPALLGKTHMEEFASISKLDSLIVRSNEIRSELLEKYHIPQQEAILQDNVKIAEYEIKKTFAEKFNHPELEKLPIEEIETIAKKDSLQEFQDKISAYKENKNALERIRAHEKIINDVVNDNIKTIEEIKASKQN
jgi:type IV secretion system protein VirB6